MDTSTLLRATSIAATRATTLHEKLNQALLDLEARVEEQRATRVQLLRERTAAMDTTAAAAAATMIGTTTTTTATTTSQRGKYSGTC